MSTHRSTWKQRERQAATMFGTKRQYGSGSGGRADETRSDSKHPRLFIECKLREKHSAVTLWDSTHELAKKEGKKAVIMLSEKGRPSQWLMCRSTDFDAILVERLAAMSDDERTDVMRKLWALNGVSE